MHAYIYITSPFRCSSLGPPGKKYGCSSRCKGPIMDPSDAQAIHTPDPLLRSIRPDHRTTIHSRFLIHSYITCILYILYILYINLSDIISTRIGQADLENGQSIYGAQMLSSLTSSRSAPKVLICLPTIWKAGG